MKTVPVTSSAPKLPYRSKKRDVQLEARRLEAQREISQTMANLMFGEVSQARRVHSPGEIFFDESGRTLTKVLRTAISHNRKELDSLYGKEFRRILNCIDDLWIITSRYTWTVYKWVYVQPNPMQEVLFECLYKSVLSLYACQRLTSDGLFGLGRPHLRHAFESLMIAKFCAVNPSSDVYDKWVDGVEVYFANAILKKISHPSTDEFLKLWKLLCQLSHATIFSSQGSLTLKETAEGTALNIAWSKIFIQWMYHLIQHMITPTVRYYGDRYAFSKEAEKARSRLKKAFQLHNKHLAPESLRLIRRFRATWKLK